MSIIIKAGSDICKANTNTSTAKFQYSFSKASRFPIPNHAEEIRKKRIQDKIDKGELEPEKPKKVSNYEYQYYKLLPSTLSQRKTTFGKGNKSDFTKGGNNCKESYYNPYTDFDPKNPHGPKYSFTHANRNGKGPTKTKKQEIEEKEKEENKDKEDNDKNKKIIDLDGPSPASYNYLKQFGWDAPKVSMKGRHNTPIKKKGEKEGEENEKKKEEEPYLTKVTIQIRNTGKYVVSQIPNVNSLKFDKDKSKRTQFVANKNPGPSDYPQKPLLGRVVQSQYRSYEQITMAGKHKVKDSRSNYPGPGSYIIPSDFGIYQSKDASKYPQENVYPEPKPKMTDDKPWRHGMKIIKPKKEEDDEGGNDNYNNDEETPGETPGQNEDEKEKEEEEKRKAEEEERQRKEEEERKKKEEEEDKKNEEEDKKNEEDKESEAVMLREILEYKEGEDNQTPTPNA